MADCHRLRLKKNLTSCPGLVDHYNHLLGVHMKELLCFTIGPVVGAVVMKKTHAAHELKKKLEHEKLRNHPPSGS